MEREPIWEKEDEEIGADREYWGEEEWERFMAQQDRKMDELMRLSDLFMNSDMKPSVDFGLMGFEDCDNNCAECPDRYSCWKHQEQVAEESREATGIPEPVIEDDEPEDRLHGYKKLTAYQESFKFGVAAFQWIHEMPKNKSEQIPALIKLVHNCGIPGAKIAGGHGIGYMSGSICGNIVNCRRGERAMVASVEALQELVGYPEYAEKARILLEHGEETLQLIRERISTLRAEARRLHGESE